MAKKSNSYKKKTNKGDKKVSLLKPFKNLIEFFRGEKVRRVVGLTLLLFSAYLLIAFTSFLFTWKADQDKVMGVWGDLLFNPEIQVENWLGKVGAITAHQFIHNWFGVSSFLFVFVFFLLGFKALFRISLFSISKSLKYSFFALLWFSISFGYFVGEPWFLGGTFGYTINNWLVSIIGNMGTGFFILFSLLVFTIVSFDFSLNFLKDLFQKETPGDVEEGEDGFQDAQSLQNTLVEKEEGPAEVDLNDNAEEPTDSEPVELEKEINPDASGEKKESPIIEGDSDFEVEAAKEEDEQLSEEELDKKVKEFGEYDPTLDLAKYQLPTIDLLEDHGNSEISVDRDELEANKNKIVETLGNYNIKIDKIKATIGPTVTLYEIVPEAGTRISKIKNLEDDIALSLAALGIRIIAPIPGKGTIGIEVPNKNAKIVSMRTVVASEKFQNSKMELPVVIGKTISNETFVTDLAKMPHLLMAGATGQGKSVGLNTILVSLLYKKHPSQIKFVLVDPKKVELTLFNKIERHFLAKLPDSEEAIITDTKKVVNTLNSLCIEMDQRYDLLKTAMVRNIKEYNTKFVQRKLNPEKGHRFMPYIVLVVDEFADLIMTAGKEVETPIARLAQLARAIGIHLIIATQRPSVNIITGTIKANFPTRIAFRVTSKIDSRTILDAGGADQLIGRGDMLLSTGSEIIRLQCAFVDTPEVENITEFIGNQQAYPDAFILPEYIDENSSQPGDVDLNDKDDMFDDAARIVVQHQQGSASLLQRRLKLGYNRAGRIVDQLEAAGIIGPFEGSKARQVLIPDEYALEQLLNSNENNE